MVEERGTDALPDEVPAGAAGDELHLALVHDVLELLPYLPHLTHRLHVDEVLRRPARGVAIGEG